MEALTHESQLRAGHALLRNYLDHCMFSHVTCACQMRRSVTLEGLKKPISAQLTQFTELM